MTAEEYRTVRAMERYGGSFVAQLAKLYRLADEENRNRIRATWPEYWQRYQTMGAEDQCTSTSTPS